MNDMHDPTQHNSYLPSLVNGVPGTPMTIGQILERIFQLIKMNWRLLFGVAVVPFGVGAIICGGILAFMLPTFLELIKEQSQASGVAAIAGPPSWFWILFVCSYPLFLAIFGIYMAAGTFAANRADLGIGVTIRQAYEMVLQRLGRHLWLMILCVLCSLIPMLVTILIFGVLSAIMGMVHSNPSGVFLLLPLLVLSYVGIFVALVIIMLRLALAFPACVEEDITAWAAIKRSFRLTHKAMGRIFVVMLVIYAISYAVMIAIEIVLFVVAALGMAAGVAGKVAPGSPIFIALIGLGVSAFVILFLIYSVISYSAITTAISVIYHDQKRRLEGLEPALPNA